MVSATEFARQRVGDSPHSRDWNVLIEGPPHGQSCPTQVLKYLARYLAGGPISDRRILSDQEGRVAFWARGKSRVQGNRSRPFSLPGREFVRRWAMHILPKGYTRCRQFGGFHGRNRAAYLDRCRQLLAKSTGTATLPSADEAPSGPPRAPASREPSVPLCRHCNVPLQCISQQRRPSWKLIFQRRIYEDHQLYSPMHHIGSRAPPPFPLDEEGSPRS